MKRAKRVTCCPMIFQLHAFAFPCPLFRLLPFSSSQLSLLLLLIHHFNLSSRRISHQRNPILSLSPSPHRHSVCLLASASKCWLQSSKENFAASLAPSRILMDRGLQFDHLYRSTSVVRLQKVSCGSPLPRASRNVSNDGLGSRRMGRIYKSDAVFCTHPSKLMNSNKDDPGCLRLDEKKRVPPRSHEMMSPFLAFLKAYHNIK